MPLRNKMTERVSGYRCMPTVDPPARVSDTFCHESDARRAATMTGLRWCSERRNREQTAKKSTTTQTRDRSSPRWVRDERCITVRRRRVIGGSIVAPTRKRLAPQERDVCHHVTAATEYNRLESVCPMTGHSSNTVHNGPSTSRVVEYRSLLQNTQYVRRPTTQ